MSAYSSDESTLIASADCQKEDHQPGTGMSLCSKEHTSAIPHIMYGQPGNLQEYQGGRSFDELKAFVESHKGQQPSPATPSTSDGDSTCPISLPTSKVTVSASTMPDCKSKKCPTKCQCAEDQCSSEMKRCMDDYICRNGEDCANECACGDTSCLAMCTAMHSSVTTYALLSCATTAHCESSNAPVAV